MNNTILNFHLGTLGIFYVITFGPLVHPGPHTVSPIHAHGPFFKKHNRCVSNCSLCTFLRSLFIV